MVREAPVRANLAISSSLNEKYMTHFRLLGLVFGTALAAPLRNGITLIVRIGPLDTTPRVLQLLFVLLDPLHPWWCMI